MNTQTASTPGEIDVADENPLRLLLVDDDAVDIRAIKRNLQKSGLVAHLTVVSDPEKANEIARQNTCDCILLDYRFPTGTAFELFADLLSTSCSQRPGIVLLTGTGGESIAAQSIQRGAQEYMSKAELAPMTLRRHIESACEKAALQKQLELRDQQLVRMSFYDSLTGLPNRQLFFDRLGQAGRDAERTGKRFAVLMMDLNLFKTVNDTYGHEAGDILLAQIALRLQQTVRDADTVARLGGDEFAALLSTADSVEGAVIVAEKIRSSVCKDIVIRENSVRVGISIGISLFPDDATDVESLLRHADVALYKGKASNSTIVVYGSRLSTSKRETGTFAHARTGTVPDEQYFLHFEPQIRLSDGAVIGAEALVHSPHPQLGMRLPRKFAAIAERSENTEAISLHLINRALEQNRRWRDSGLDLSISANLSSRLLDRETLADALHSLLISTTVAPCKLCLQITETGIMNSPDQAARTLTALSALGIRISIDEFGNGNSTPECLRNIPMDEIKINPLFISAMGGQQQDDTITKAIIALGKQYKVRVVAEGIGDDLVWHQLHSLACDCGQGPRIARPMAEDDFNAWYRTWNNKPPQLPWLKSPTDC